MSSKSENTRTLIFMLVLSCACALLLSVVASSLKGAQDKAEELDRAKQLLIAAQILNYAETFQILENGKNVPAKWDQASKQLVKGTTQDIATASDIFDVLKTRVSAYLVNDNGELKTFAEAGINQNAYLTDAWKIGYAKQSWKLVYQVLPNNPLPPASSDNPHNIFDANGYIFPINGFGLWDAIYGYLAVSIDADTVLGTTWYWQKETAGLGAIIASPSWQEQFPGKLIFQQSPNSTTDFKTAPLGLSVIRGAVKDILGTSPKSYSAIDGISGATLTANGVTSAYKDSLGPYRPFLLNLRAGWEQRHPGGQHS